MNTGNPGLAGSWWPSSNVYLGTTVNGAKSNCSLPGLTPGSRGAVTQYVSGGFDYDYACKS